MGTFRRTVSEGDAVADPAIPTDDGTIVDDQALPMFDPETGADAGFPWDFDSQDPFDADPIGDADDPTDGAKDAAATAGRLGNPKIRSDESTLGISLVGHPIGFHTGPRGRFRHGSFDSREGGDYNFRFSIADFRLGGKGGVPCSLFLVSGFWFETKNEARRTTNNPRR